MLTKPNINELSEKIDNRYLLVLAVAKRARQIHDGAEVLVKTKEDSSVSVAAEEIGAERVVVIEE